MKTFLQFFCLFPILIVITCCDLFSVKTGPLEGMKIYVNIASESSSLKKFSRVNETSHTFPENAKIAVTKIWLPYVVTYNSLKTKYIESEETLVLSDVDFDNYDFYKPLTRTDEDPYIFDAGSGVPFEPEIPPPYNATFHGVLLETLYWEFEMSDFTIRWYQRDSGYYKRGDVLVNDGTGWKWVYLQRTMTFTFVWKDTAYIQNAYEQIIESPADISEMPVEVILSSIRQVPGAHFENWTGAHIVDVPNLDYIYKALKTYRLSDQSNSTIYDYLRAESYCNEGSHEEIEYTLKQYYNIAGDTRMDATPGEYAVGENPLEQLPQVGTYRHPNTWDRGLHPYPFIMLGSEGSLDNPYELKTFSEEENEAEYWLILISYDFRNTMAIDCGLVFQSYRQTPPEITWSNINDLNYFYTLNPIAGGIEFRMGWQDFEGNIQGELSPDALAP